mmetsp:Transcript_36495/g.57269  ORF Transcript_36495/g.57269 Transcript_36495/m.57269 type:complete len:182 (-) Transcript_36495:153-698(-)
MGVRDAVKAGANEVKNARNDAQGDSRANAPPPPKRDTWPSGLCSCTSGVCCWAMFCCCCHVPQLLVRSGKAQPGESNLSGCCNEQPLPLQPCSCVNVPLCWLMFVCPIVGWCKVCSIRKFSRDQWLDTDAYQSTIPRWLVRCMCICCDLQQCDTCLVATCCPCCSNIQAHVLMDEELGSVV